ncbi:MAG: YraN family protein [Clostridiales bacterium]|nr:YraN family protein [Clostridiales bacterium]
MLNNRGIGKHYEELACSYLEQNGFEVAEKNFRSRNGEIDIIGYHGEFLVFVEVKYRATDKKGMPEEAVIPAKQKRICKTADYYRFLHKYSDDRPVRYDVVGISGTEEAVNIRWYRNAFAHIYAR